MGCHTWFYKRLENPPSKEEMVSKLSTLFNEELNYIKNNPYKDEFGDSLTNEEYTYKLNFFENCLKVVTDNIEFYDENFDDKKITIESLYCHFSYDDIILYHKGKFYVDSDEYHDLFRKYGYPDDVLESYQETLDYINNPDNNCIIYYDGCYDKLKEYWEKYPDGIICFG